MNEGYDCLKWYLFYIILSILVIGVTVFLYLNFIGETK